MSKGDVVPSTKLAFKNFTREQKFVFLSLSIGYVSIFCTSTIISPALPPEGARHGVTPSVIGMIFSSGDIISFFASPFVGVLVAIIGPKIVIVGGMILFGAFMMIFGLLELVDSYEWFVAGCFICMILSSFGKTGIYTATVTYAAQTFPDNISLIMGLTETYVAIGEIISLLSGGPLQELGGYKLPFVLFGTLNLLVVPLHIYLLPRDKKIPKESQEIELNQQTAVDVQLQSKDVNAVSLAATGESVVPISFEERKGEVVKRTLQNGKELPDHLRMWHLATIPKTVLMTLILINVGICWSFLMSTLEPHLSPLKLSKTQTNLMFLLTSVVFGLSSPVCGWFAGVLKKKAWMFMIVGLVVVAVNFCFMGPLPFFGLENTVWLNIITLSIFTIALAATGIPACEAVILYTIDAGHRDNRETYAIVSSLISTAYNAGDAIGAFAGGFLVESFGFPVTASLYGALSLILGGVVLSYFTLCDKQPAPHKKSTNKAP